MKKIEPLNTWENGIIAHIKRNKNKANLFTCTVAHVSSSGMMRHIKVGMVYKGDFVNINHLVANLAEYRRTKRGDYCLIVGGCGMDMCFSVLQNFGGSIFGRKFDSGFTAFQHYRYF